MDKLTDSKTNCKEDTDTFIQRLTDPDDNFNEETYDGYVLEIEQESYDP